MPSHPSFSAPHAEQLSVTHGTEQEKWGFSRVEEWIVLAQFITHGRRPPRDRNREGGGRRARLRGRVSDVQPLADALGK